VTVYFAMLGPTHLPGSRVDTGRFKDSKISGTPHETKEGAKGEIDTLRAESPWAFMLTHLWVKKEASIKEDGKW